MLPHGLDLVVAFEIKRIILALAASHAVIISTPVVNPCPVCPTAPASRGAGVSPLLRVASGWWLNPSLRRLPFAAADTSFLVLDQGSGFAAELFDLDVHQ